MQTLTEQAMHSQPDGAAKLPVIIVPGFHSPALSAQLIESLPSFVRVTVADAFPASPFAVYQWLQANVSISSDGKSPAPPIVAIGFSAGVVGLAGGLALWQRQGGKVGRLIAVDGWGVPVIGLPVTRISHDYFTHMSTLPLGASDVNFFASPPVPHLQLWGQPETVSGIAVSGGKDGFWQNPSGAGIAMSAAAFLRRSLHKEWNAAFSWRAKSDGN